MIQSLPTTQLPVQERIMLLVELTSGARHALAEICKTTEFGKDRCCWMNNRAMGKAIGCHFMTASRYIQELQEFGLVILAPELMNRATRCLVPSQNVRAIYASKNWKECLLTLRNLITIRIADNYPTQSEYHNKSLIKKGIKEVDTAPTSQIAELEAEVQSAKAACAAKQIEIDFLLAENKHLEASVGRLVLEALALSKSAAANASIWEAMPKPPEPGTDLSNAFYQHEFAKKKVKAADPAKQTTNANRQQIIDTHFKWFKERNGFKPAVRDMDAKAALGLFNYFRGQDQVQTDVDAHNTFAMLLNSWSRLDSFSQKRQTIFEINNNINNLIPQLTNGTQQSTRNKELGLSDHTQRHAAAEYLKSIGLE